MRNETPLGCCCMKRTLWSRFDSTSWCSCVDVWDDACLKSRSDCCCRFFTHLLTVNLGTHTCTHARACAHACMHARTHVCIHARNTHTTTRTATGMGSCMNAHTAKVISGSFLVLNHFPHLSYFLNRLHQMCIINMNVFFSIKSLCVISNKHDKC